MKLKHTSGPWVKDYRGTINHIKAIINEEKTPTLCRYNDEFKNGGSPLVANSLTEEEREANGLLIAAAPEMLEALITTYSILFLNDSERTIIKSEYIELIEKATDMKIKDIFLDNIKE